MTSKSKSKSRHRCPACNNPLTVEKEDSTLLVHCTNGRCPSEKASDGVKGYDSEAALAKTLIERLNLDPDWPIDVPT